MLTDGFHMQTEPEEYDEIKSIHCTVYCLGLIWIYPDESQNQKNKKKTLKLEGWYKKAA